MILRRRRRGERPADGRGRILIDQVLSHRIGKHCRHPLAYATRRLETAARFDAAQRVEDNRDGYHADRHRAERREGVALEAGKDVGRVNVRPAPMLVRMPLARPMLESTSPAGRGGISRARIHTAAELLARLVATGPSCVQRHLGNGTDRQQLLFAVETKLYSERHSACWHDVKVEAALVEPLVGGRARPDADNKGGHFV
jgi:hypothetical protein